VQLTSHEEAASFLGAASELLLADEARHNLILGLCATLAESSAYPDFRLWTVEDSGRCLAAALWTPPYNLVLARPANTAALAFMAQDLQRRGVALPGVTGAIPEAERFAALWAELTGSQSRARMRQAIYKVASPRRPADVPGAMRQATAGDRPFLVDWARAFEAEALPDDAPFRAPEEILDTRLGSAQGGIALWEDGRPVSMAGFGGPTPHGIRIGPVYTPPERRRRGYASALVAALSLELLAAGRDYCFLYTDLANPTSNSIYQRIGYRPVSDVNEWSFE
jgi:predicted GNAT family acetyltransferase